MSRENRHDVRGENVRGEKPHKNLKTHSPDVSNAIEENEWGNGMVSHSIHDYRVLAHNR